MSYNWLKKNKNNGKKSTQKSKWSRSDYFVKNKGENRIFKNISIGPFSWNLISGHARVHKIFSRGGGVNVFAWGGGVLIAFFISRTSTIKSILS